jgi:hypothetical protein
MPIGIVYSKNQGVSRRVIITDSSLEPHRASLAEGEGLVEVSEADYRMYSNEQGRPDEFINGLVKKYTGIETKSDRHVVVRDGEVIALEKGDPAIDGAEWNRRHPNAEIEHNKEAKLGHKRINGKFERPLTQEEIDALRGK